MKRLAIILLAAAIGLGVGAAVSFARGGGGHRIPLASPVASSQKAEALQQDSPNGMKAPEDDQKHLTLVAPCDPEAMLPVIAEAIDPRSDLGRFWDSVDIKECQNRYARVFAVTAGPPPPPGTQLEGSEQVFLQDVGGEWKMLSSGSGLDCYPGSMPPDLKDACEALGLP
jgi:hypothetical protein